MYMAMFAIAMSGCSQEDLTEQTDRQINVIKAEICSDSESRLIVGDKNAEGKSPLNWSETDAFVTFKSLAEIKNHSTFYATYYNSKDGIVYQPTVDFFSKTPVNSSDIVYGLYPEKKVDVTASAEQLKVQVSPELDMTNSQNAIMLGQNVKGTMKFYQTMGMLEMHFNSLEGIDGLQIKANRAIASKEAKGCNASLAIPADLKDAKVTLAADDSKTILLNKGFGSFDKIYCPLPVADDYTEITISYVFKVGFNKVVSDTPYVTIKAKNGTFSVGKNIYAVDCTSSNTTYTGASLPTWREQDLESGK